jgi:pimeloyl-ACP methyl ester carboxylesterase
MMQRDCDRGDSSEPRPVSFSGHNGVTIAGDAYGDPGAPPAIFLPGGGQTRHAWGGAAQTLAADGWYALSLDLRGHGDSSWAPDGDYSLEAFVGDLCSVVAQLDRRPAVVGASLGGITALLTAGEVEGPPTSAIVLVDIVPRMEKDGVDRIVTFMRAHMEGFASLEAAADAVAAYIPHRPRPADLSGLAKNLRRGNDGRYRWHWDPEFVTGTQRPNGSQNPERLLAAARRLTVPTLLVRGRMSDVISEAGAREFLAAVPHARYVDVSGAGHMVAGDRNDIFAQAVTDFLHALPPDEPATRCRRGE